MKNLKTYLILFSVQALLIVLLLELGFRIWLNYAQEDSTTFENHISNSAQSPATRITGRVTLGRLIKKSLNPDRVYEFMPNIHGRQTYNLSQVRELSKK